MQSYVRDGASVVFDGNPILLATMMLAVLVVPGACFAWLIGSRLRDAVIVALPVTAGLWGTTAAVFGALNIAFTAPTVAVATAVYCGLALALRVGLALRKRARRNSATQAGVDAPLGEEHSTEAALPPEPQPAAAQTADEQQPATSRLRTFGQRAFTVGVPLVGVITAICLMFARALRMFAGQPHGIAQVFQGWDVQWHANVIRFIMDERVASATHMGKLQYVVDQREMFYPSGWHSMVFVAAQVLNLSPIVAVNLASFVLPATGFAVSSAVLGWLAAGRVGGSRANRVDVLQVLAAALAPVIVAGMLSVLYIGLFVGAWPYVAALSLIGAVLWAFVQIPRRPSTVVVAAFALIGSTMMHPAPSAVVALMLVFWWFGAGVWRRFAVGRWARLRGAVRSMLWMGVAGALALVVLVPQFVLGSQVVSDVTSYGHGVNIPAKFAWSQVLMLQTEHVWEYGIDWWLLALIALGLLVVLWRRAVWVVALYALLVSIAVASLTKLPGLFGEVVQRLGSLHYNATHRLQIPVAMLAGVLAAVALAALLLGVVWLLALVVRPLRQSGVGVAVVSSVLAVAAAVLIVVAGQGPREDAYQQRLAGSYVVPGVIEDSEFVAYDWLAEQPYAYDGLIVTNPDQGAGWMYAYNGLPSLHRHYLWPAQDTDAAFFTFWYLDRVGEGVDEDADGSVDQGANPAELGSSTPLPAQEPNIVDEVLRELNVHYVVMSPPGYWPGNLKVASQQQEALFATAGLVPVFQLENTVIYAVRAAFTEDELQRVLADSPHPPVGPAPSPEGLSEAGPIDLRPQAWRFEAGRVLPQGGSEQ